MINWAIVPTTISDNADEIRNHIASRLATNASPNHSAASAQTLVIRNTPIARASHSTMRGRSNTQSVGASQTRAGED
jgi:hypothetical protein